MERSGFKISFRITHPENDLELAAKKLGKTPFRIWKAGSQRETPKGDRLDGKYSCSYCCLMLDEEEGVHVSHLISNFLDELEIDAEYWSDFARSGGDLCLVIFNENEKKDGYYVDEFDWELFGRLFRLKICLGFDV